jgi:hypothetical protein
VDPRPDAEPPREIGRNDAERWFERYVHGHDYSYDYEPDLRVSTRPDFVIERAGTRVVCEVKGFEQPSAFKNRLSQAVGAFMAGDDEIYRPMRSAVREAARQLKPLAGTGLPLVVVLADPRDHVVLLDIEHLVEAMFGNPGWTGSLNESTGEVEGLHFAYGQDGRLRNDHPYISAVLILRKVDLGYEYRQAWGRAWVDGRPRVSWKEHGFEAVATAMQEERKAWESHVAEANVPAGYAYKVDVLTTGSASATPVPDEVFNGPRDRRTIVEREPSVGS